MRTSVVVDRDAAGRVRVRMRGAHLAPRLLERGPDHARVALVATVALLLAGDRVGIDVDVACDVHLELVETSGTVAYDMRGGAASWDVAARVAAGGSLHWGALPLVVSAGADVTRTTRLEVDEDAEVRLRETVVLGRSGEVGGDLHVASTVVRPDGSPVLREDLDLTRAGRGGAAVLGGARCLDSLTVLGRRVGVDGPDVLQLDAPGSVVRALVDELHLSPVNRIWCSFPPGNIMPNPTGNAGVTVRS